MSEARIPSIKDRCAVLDNQIEEAQRVGNHARLDALIAIRRDVFLAEAYRRVRDASAKPWFTGAAIKAELDALYTAYSPIGVELGKALTKRKEIKKISRPEPKYRHTIVKRRSGNRR